MTLEDENTRLRAENAALREQVQGLLAEVHQLRGQLAQDSRNSSKPPSSDGFARKTKSLRQKSGKKPGGQPGHRGHHVRLVETPDTVVEHRPARCGGCQQELPEDAPHWIERRQVHELPPVRLTVTEHQILHRRCLACGVTTEGEVPPGVAAPRQYGPRLRAVATYLIQQQFVPYARTQELFADLFGVRLSQGTLVNLVRQGAERLQPLVEQIKVALRQAPVLHQDETGLRVAGAEGAGGQWAVDARDVHQAAHPLRVPCGPGGKCAGSPWHSARLYRGQCPRRLDELPALHYRPSRAVQRASPARADLRGGGVTPTLGRPTQGAAAPDARRRRVRPCGRSDPAGAGRARSLPRSL